MAVLNPLRVVISGHPTSNIGSPKRWLYGITVLTYESSYYFMSPLISSFHAYSHLFILCLLSSLHFMSTLISIFHVYSHLFILCLNSSFYFSITKLHHCTLFHICSTYFIHSTCFIHYFTIFSCFIWIVRNYRLNLIFFISFLSSCYFYYIQLFLLTNICSCLFVEKWILRHTLV